MDMDMIVNEISLLIQNRIPNKRKENKEKAFTRALKRREHFCTNLHFLKFKYKKKKREIRYT